jgi:hypothetical protein
MERKLTVIDDPWEIRDRFLRLQHTEKDTLAFLTQIGVWKAVEDQNANAASAGKMLLDGYLGHRLFFGRALPITLEELWARQTFWKNLLSDPDRLRGEFPPPPPPTAAPFEKAEFASKAAALNTLPLHIDWQLQKRRHPDSGRVRTAIEPQGVIEPFTLWELLVATTHIDLLGQAKFQTCQRPDCAIPFTGRKRDYCCWYCGHLQSVRRGRQKRRKEKKRGKKR